MTTLTDKDLLSHAETLKGSVVLITGAANGVGRATALLFAQYGAHIIVGDIDMRRGELTVGECRRVGEDSGGEAVFVVCDVSSWEDQVALFAVGVEKFGRVDLVVINAGEIPYSTSLPTTKVLLRIPLCTLTIPLSLRHLSHILKNHPGVSPTKDGFFTLFTLPNRQSSPPIKPKTSILDVNLVGAMYTARLAQYYLLKNKSSRPKSIVFMGSMTGLNPVPKVEIYSASKHGLLAFHASLHPSLSSQNIHCAIICPHVMDTSALDIPSRLGIAGIRATEVQRVANAVVHAVAGETITGNEDMRGSGGMYVLPDDGPVLWIARGERGQAVYKLVKARVESDVRIYTGPKHYYAVMRDACFVLVALVPWWIIPLLLMFGGGLYFKASLVYLVYAVVGM